MIKIPIKPISVNVVWAGRRFKTYAYKKYERDLLLLLPSRVQIPKGKLTVAIEWGFSSSASDLDNPIKPFLDVLQKKYGFDDKRIYSLNLTKVDVKKGQEYIKFAIHSL